MGRLKSGKLTPDQSLALAKRAAAAAPALAFADATRAYASPAWIRDAAVAVRGEARDVLIIIDSVHSWADGSMDDINEYDRLGQSLGALRTIAGALTCPILCIAERNRANMSKGGLSASAGSWKFEYGGETVLDLGREENAVPNQNGEIPVTLTIQKNRNGNSGKKIPLLFHGALQRFTEA